MMNPAFWTLDFTLETLNLLGRISPEDYEYLMKLKNRRNDVMHEGERVPQDEAEKCFDVTKTIVKKRLG